MAKAVKGRRTQSLLTVRVLKKLQVHGRQFGLTITATGRLEPVQYGKMSCERVAKFLAALPAMLGESSKTTQIVEHYCQAVVDGLLVVKLEAEQDLAPMLTLLLACGKLPHVWRINTISRVGSLMMVAEVKSQRDLADDRGEAGGSLTVSMRLVTYSVDGSREAVVCWKPGVVLRRTVKDILHQVGLSIPTDDDVSDHDYAVRQVEALAVGDRCLFSGMGFGGLDDKFTGQPYAKTNIAAVMDQRIDVVSCYREPVVVDILSESVTDVRFDPDVYSFWSERWCRFADKSQAYHEFLNELPEVTHKHYAYCQISRSRYLPVMVLRTNSRVLASVDNLEPYPYLNRDDALEALELPHMMPILRALSGEKLAPFKDVIDGKSQADNVLFTGLAGTGKTLACELVAEASGKLLYVVQASQLGMDIDNLRQRLQVVDDRLVRWSADGCLDDADVYIAERGHSLQQNAIVGTMFNFLERSSSRIFITTNLTDVDHAIQSRCFVRLKFDLPSVSTCRSIWRRLAQRNGMTFSSSVIDKVCSEYVFSGREVLQMLKLLRQVLGRGPYGLGDVRRYAAMVANRKRE